MKWVEAATIVGEALSEAGTREAKRVWRFDVGPIQWLVQVERPPYGERVGIDVGVDLFGRAPDGPNKCPIIWAVQRMSLRLDVDIPTTLDLRIAMDPAERQQALAAMVAALIDYIHAHKSIESIRVAYRDGDLKAAFIHRDARAVLEASEPQ